MNTGKTILLTADNNSQSFNPGPQAANPATNSESSIFQSPILLEIWTVMRNRKWLIGAILLGSLILGLLATLFATPYYTAKTRIEINRLQSNVTNVEGAQPRELQHDPEFFQTQYSLLQARSLAERVALKANLAADNKFFDAFGIDPEGRSLADGKATGSLTATERNRRLKLATNILLGNVAINPIRGSKLIDVQFSSPDATLSAKVANIWAEEFVQSGLDRRFSATADGRQYLQERLDELRTKLEESEQKLVAYATEKQIVTLSSSTDSNGKTNPERTLAASDLETLNNALAQAKADRIRAQSESNFSGGLGKEVANSPSVGYLQQRRAEVAAEYAKLLVTYEPQYPAAQALKVQMNELDRSIAAEKSRIQSGFQSGAQAGYRQALEREQKLTAQVEALKDTLLSQKRDSIQYSIYQRDVDTNRQLYDGLLQRFKEVGVAGIGSNNVSIIDRALVPNSPSSPNLFFNLALALLGGLLAAGGVTFLIEQLDQTLKDPSDVRKMLNLPMLGSIPLQGKGDILELLDDKKSLVSEAYMSIQTNLSFSTDHGVPKSFLMTSSRPSEGKSTSAYALAKMLARTGKNVILVDADLRNPSMHHLTGILVDRGLSNILAGDDNVGSFLQKTELKNLTVLPVGPRPPNPSELLNGDRLANLITQLLQQFDHVVIDGPPVLGLADVPLISRAVEGIIFAVEAGGSKLKDIQGAIQRIQSANARIFGVIVTKLDTERLSYGAYSYDYSYGRTAKDLANV